MSKIFLLISYLAVEKRHLGKVPPLSSTSPCPHVPEFPRPLVPESLRPQAPKSPSPHVPESQRPHVPASSGPSPDVPVPLLVIAEPWPRVGGGGGGGTPHISYTAVYWHVRPNGGSDLGTPDLG